MANNYLSPPCVPSTHSATKRLRKWPDHVVMPSLLTVVPFPSSGPPPTLSNGFSICPVRIPIRQMISYPQTEPERCVRRVHDESHRQYSLPSD